MPSPQELIPAREARPGKKYRSLKGTTIVVYEEANSRWRSPRPNNLAIPYKVPAAPRSKNPLRQIAVYGWLNHDYMLLPLS